MTKLSAKHDVIQLAKTRKTVAYLIYNPRIFRLPPEERYIPSFHFSGGELLGYATEKGKFVSLE